VPIKAATASNGRIDFLNIVPPYLLGMMRRKLRAELSQIAHCEDTKTERRGIVRGQGKGGYIP
jgi:hypothetical protein